MSKSSSIYAEAWKKLKRDNLAKVGSVIILIACVVALLGPTIRPDTSGDADKQILQLKALKPGFEIDQILVTKNKPAPKNNFFKTLVFGSESPYETPIPVVKYWFDGDYIYGERFLGSVDVTDTVKYHIINVVYPINIKDADIKSTKEGYTYRNLEGYEVSVNKAECIQTIEKNHIIRPTYYLGTDRNGRDFLSRIMAGTRISLGVGVIAVSISLLIGILMGAMAGFFRGWVDELISWIINVFWSIPALLLVIAITLSLGKGIEVVFIAVGLTMWVEVARIVRGQFLTISSFEFVEAGRALGFTNGRLIFRHILPNTVGPIIVVAISNFATAILLESGLSFLGLGVQPPQASWGAMVGSYSAYLIGDFAYLAILPGIAIVLLVVAFFMLGNGLRDAFDVRGKE